LIQLTTPTFMTSFAHARIADVLFCVKEQQL
jgi:hypothetical protein